MTPFQEVGAFHYANDVQMVLGSAAGWPSGFTGGFGDGFLEIDQFTYTFENFFHPFVGELIQKLNRTDVAGMLDPAFLATLVAPYAASDYSLVASGAGNAISTVSVDLQPRTVDLAAGGPYANYNWELLYHIPVLVAVHLSNNQRFAEAQKWFHLVFDPTCTDAHVPTPQRFWRFLAFRNQANVQNINTLLQLLSTPDSQLDAPALATKQSVLTGYNAMLSNPLMRAA